MENNKEHICTYTEAYRTLNSYEPSLTNLGMECKECGSFLYCTAETKEINKIPKGTHTFKGQSKTEREESRKKSIAIRNKQRAKMGFPPLNETEPSLEERVNSFEELMRYIRGKR